MHHARGAQTTQPELLARRLHSRQIIAPLPASVTANEPAPAAATVSTTTAAASVAAKVAAEVFFVTPRILPRSKRGVGGVIPLLVQDGAAVDKRHGEGFNLAVRVQEPAKIPRTYDKQRGRVVASV